MLYPFPHHPRELGDNKLKRHAEILGRIAKIKKHQQNGENIPRVGWVAFARGVARRGTIRALVVSMDGKAGWTAARVNPPPAPVLLGGAEQAPSLSDGSYLKESHNHVSDRVVNRLPQLLGSSAPWESTTSRWPSLSASQYVLISAHVNASFPSQTSHRQLLT